MRGVRREEKKDERAGGGGRERKGEGGGLGSRGVRERGRGSKRERQEKRMLEEEAG